MKIKEKNEDKPITYFQDEINDEFSKSNLEPRKIDGNYKYEHNVIWDLCSYFLQNFVSMPIKTLYLKIRFRHTYIGKEKLKKYKKSGYFIYANHTQPFADTFIPSVAIYPKRNFLIVNPVNISLKGTGTLVEMLGAIPLPSDKISMKNFLKTIKNKLEKNSSITIYPEAHIWPFYTKIRPFKAVSFTYPIQFDTPTFCMTNTYQTYGKKNNKLKIVTYIDGPFFPDKTLTNKEQKQALRDTVYNCMTQRSLNSNFELITYKQKKD